MPRNSHVARPLVSASALTIRPPRLEDARSIWQLVDRCPVLDTNSCYAYLLLCRDFAATCRVAELDGQLLGFVTAYCPPHRPDVVFVWQVAVDASARRLRVGKRLLRALVEQLVQHDQVRYLEATISPSNGASRRLFRGLADDLQADFEVGPGFPSDLFADGSHEEEDLIRIGPLRP